MHFGGVDKQLGSIVYQSVDLTDQLCRFSIVLYAIVQD